MLGQQTNIDTRLLFLILEAHTRIRVLLSGSLTSEFPMGKAAKQGCVLAPVLFLLYINYTVPRLTGLKFVPLSLGQQKISVLLYAVVVSSLTRIVSKRLVDELGDYGAEEKFTIKYLKTKVVVFQKRPKRHTNKYPSRTVKNL